METVISAQKAFEKEFVSVFESMRSYGGVLFRFEDHWERLRASAKTAGLTIGENAGEIRRMVYGELGRSWKKDAFLRVTVNPQGLSVTVTTRTYPPEIFEKGVTIVTSTVRKNLSRAFYPEAKTSTYLGQVMATLEARTDAFEILFLGEDGMVRETRNSNIFMVKNNQLFTPPLAGILEGVTRKVVLECAKDIGLAAAEEFFTRHELFNADEAFLTNTSGEIIPVRELDNRRVGGLIPGLWTKRLMNQFRKKVNQYKKERGRVEN